MYSKEELKESTHYLELADESPNEDLNQDLKFEDDNLQISHKTNPGNPWREVSGKSKHEKLISKFNPDTA